MLSAAEENKIEGIEFDGVIIRMIYMELIYDNERWIMNSNSMASISRLMKGLSLKFFGIRKQSSRLRA